MAKPKYLGVKDGQLARLPKTPNAVASYVAGEYPQMEPLSYSADLKTARETLVNLVKSMPRANIESVEGNYVHATFRSRLFRFVDDVEFLIDDATKTIQFRAGARMGHSDLKVNMKRMQEIQQKFSA